MDDLVDYVVILLDTEVHRSMTYGILHFVSFTLQKK